MFDDVHNCVISGCNIDGDSGWGFWTSTTLGRAGSGSLVWRIFYDGGLYPDDASMDWQNGIRPVITVPKNVIK